MKELKFLLILALIGYCFTDIDTTICETEFEKLLKQKCNDIDSSCSYDEDEHKCIETRDCSYGNGNVRSTCQSIHPASPHDFHKEKCILEGTNCKPKNKQCSDYNTNSITGDICSELEAPDNQQRCILIETSFSTICVPHYNDCTKITTNDNNKCTNNIPEDPLYKCSWNTAESKCKPEKRYCDDIDLYYKDSETCPRIPIAETVTDYGKKKCIFSGTRCESVYEKCDDRTVSSGSYCESYMPLNTNKDDFNYTQKCTEDTSSSSIKCKSVKRKCTEYNKVNIPIPGNLLSEEMCNKLEVSEDYYRCAYNEASKKCYEEYIKCEDYTNNKVETGRSGCENIVLTDKNKKCVYIDEKDQCETRTIYSNCKDYPGNDKKICESIVLSPNNSSYCILEKDKECIEKSINCSEAYGEKDCLNIAKASENNKRCAYDTNDGECYEEYIRCEDYIGTSSDDCEKIKLYDGKTCKYELISSINGNIYSCRSNYKTCEEAETKEECKLIAKTGVSNSDRRVCDYYGSTLKCRENYKYCSDYRGTNSLTCSYIKPYDESGNEVDIRYKCKYESGIGCHRIPVECEDAGHNPILCELFSQYIKIKIKSIAYSMVVHVLHNFKDAKILNKVLLYLHLHAVIIL